MTSIAVIGCGYVGLVSGACFARHGHRVLCIDIDEQRIEALNAGQCPIHEPGLAELIREGLRSGRLSFTAEYPEQLDVEFAFLTVNTPASRSGGADLSSVRDAVASLAGRLPPGAIIVNKSTVPIGTGDLVEGVVREHSATPIAVVSNPEFLMEGRAVETFTHPDRIVLGSKDAVAIERVAALYTWLQAPVLRTDIRTAEMIKYASNAFLATKVSFINEIAAICEATDADVETVAEGMGLDARIGPQFLAAGIGWGGSCFPKDVQALAHMAAAEGAHPQLLRSVMDINADQRRLLVRKVRDALGGIEGRRILVLGASFKPNTDDIRNSPALELADLLDTEGASVVVYDPVVEGALIQAEVPGSQVAGSVLEGARGADAIVVATDWPEFQRLPLDALGDVMARRLIVDGRNMLDPAMVAAAHFEYRCIGRPALEHVIPATVLPDVVLTTAPGTA